MTGCQSELSAGFALLEFLRVGERGQVGYAIGFASNAVVKQYLKR